MRSCGCYEKRDNHTCNVLFKKCTSSKINPNPLFSLWSEIISMDPNTYSLSKWSNYPNSIREKNQTPWTIRYFGDLAKFSRILHENKILSENSHFILHMAMISLLHWLEHRVKRCQIFRKKKQWEENYIFLKYPRNFG